MKPHLGLAAGLLSLTAIASLLSPASSVGAVNCSYSGTDRLLTVAAADSATTISRSQDAIVIADGSASVPCAGGLPTVFNTDRVQISHSGRRGDVLDLTGGPFAPGSILEPEGSPEIEFDYVDPSFVNIRGTSAADRLTWGPGGGVNLNGDNDVDVSGDFTVNIVEGHAGDDLIAPQSDYSGIGARIVSAGGTGNDTLIAPPSGAVLHGGGGRDTLSGGPKVDNITGGRGKDLVRAGKGPDLIRAMDGTKDRIDCGGGLDKVKADGIDKLKGCEGRILVKRAEPVRK